MCQSTRHIGGITAVADVRRAGIVPTLKHSSLISDWRDSKGKSKLKLK
jgi:hypothetical protein